MKLYYVPGACSLAPHIVLREAGYTFDLEKIHPTKKLTAAGEDYNQINPKGYVPALRLDDGQVLTEVTVILQYLADQKPESGLAPRPGSMERYRLMEWLNFVATEVHKQLGSLFSPKIPAEWKEFMLALLERRLGYVSDFLKGRQYLMGERFTVADAYLFTVLGWSRLLEFDLGKWPNLKEYTARVSARPAVKEAMRAEGLVK